MRRLLGAMTCTVALGCGQPALPVDEPGVVEVRTWLEGTSGKDGLLVVQTAFDPSGAVELPEPVVPGLTLQPVGDPVTERVGRREVVTQRYRFSGQGSHEIPALEARWQGGQEEPVTSSSTPLWVDLGVEPPRPGELADIQEPERVWTVPWGPVLAVGGVGGLMIAGLWLALRGARYKPVAQAPPEPPDLAALRRWDAIRVDASLSDEDKAKALSLLFREYTEAVLGFPATSWTTTEILQQLRQLAHLPQGNVPRAKRLLQATDRVKYADARVGNDLFEELDADLRAFVSSTRPQRWEGA